VIGVSSALVAAVVLLLLILVWVRAGGKPGELPSAAEEWLLDWDNNAETCPPEIVSQIFSDEDLAFVWRLEAPELKRLFRRERNAVALVWVRRTSAAIRQIMRRHLELSRMSKDLEFAVEVRIFLQYAQLQVICGVLFLLIGLAGPQKLRGMALYTERLTQSVGDVVREFESGTRAREMNGARPS
jgi:hypothetical protein